MSGFEYRLTVKFIIIEVKLVEKFLDVSLNCGDKHSQGALHF